MNNNDEYSWENSTWLENLLIQRKEYVDNIREYSRSQVDLWRKIPELAWRANGRNGWQDNYSRASRHRVWAIWSSQSGGYFNIFIDLDTGELLSAGTKYPARESCIAMAEPKDFDATRIIKELEEKINEPVDKYFTKAYEEYIAEGMI